MVDFVSLGALFGPGAPDPDLARLQIDGKWQIIDFPSHIYFYLLPRVIKQGAFVLGALCVVMHPLPG